MKKSLIAILMLGALLVLSPSLSAAPQAATPKATGQAAADQSADKAERVRPLLKSLALTPDEVSQMEKILAKDEATLSRNRADLQVLQAQLTRYLLEPNPGMDEIGRLLKKTQEIEYQDRLIQIQRQLDLRRLLGDSRWSTLLRLSRLAVEAQRTGRLKERFDTRGLTEEEARLWSRLLANSKRFLP